MPRPEKDKIPVTLVTGFLGSGKTTLLNHILKQKGNRRVAVIENEVGEINIDNSLVVENLISKEDLVSMDRGCVCCSLRNDIVNAFKELQGRATARGCAYDAILLETTGLADPAPVAFTFFANSWISSNYRLDSILCLVDAQHLRRHLEDAGGGDVNEAVNQIAFADIILLNKIDLVSAEELQKARDMVRSINVTADLIEVQLAGDSKDDADPEWDRLMGINSFSIERALQVDPFFMDSDSEDDSDGGAPDGARPLQQDGAAAPAVQPSTVAANLRPPLVGAKRSRAEANGHRTGPALAAGRGDASAQGALLLGECGAHPGPCNEECQDLSLDELLMRQKEMAAVQQATHAAAAASPSPVAAAAAAVPAQRQPKRRRKKLHDMSGVGSVGITARGMLDKYRFNMFMRDLLGEKARDIFRSKGVLCIKGQERTKFVFQGVHETICFGPAATGWQEGEETINQIIFIGRDLSRKALTEGFRSCVWVPLPEGWVEHHDVRSNQPYYVNTVTGQKQWDRPEFACPLVRSTETSHQQPSRMQPRKNGGEPVAAQA